MICSAAKHAGASEFLECKDGEKGRQFPHADASDSKVNRPVKAILVSSALAQIATNLYSEKKTFVDISVK